MRKGLSTLFSTSFAFFVLFVLFVLFVFHIFCEQTVFAADPLVVEMRNELDKLKKVVAIQQTKISSMSDRLTYPGEIKAYAGNNPPNGYLLCDGQQYNRTGTYSNLFHVIGTTWGSGDGSTTFNVPDLRGMFLRGAGTNATKLKAIGGNFSGDVVGTFLSDQGQDHKHIDAGHTHPFKRYRDVSYQSAPSWGSEGPLHQEHYGLTGYANIGGPVTNNSGTPRIGDETRPASYSINYIIKY
ncbi:MAG: tail fiber protein [Oligoflexia bacterium]|nr:tail fiber protein [Oligoflexia bacterium]